VTSLKADGERLSCRLRGPTCSFHRRINLRECQPSMIEKGFARRSQLNAMDEPAAPL
jgi:hypothetical protein